MAQQRDEIRRKALRAAQAVTFCAALIAVGGCSESHCDSAVCDEDDTVDETPPVVGRMVPPDAWVSIGTRPYEPDAMPDADASVPDADTGPPDCRMAIDFSACCEASRDAGMNGAGCAVAGPLVPPEMLA